MIAPGLPLYAVVREEPSTGILEILSCGQNADFAEARMDDYRLTSSGKRRKVTRVRLVVAEVLEEYEEQSVTK